ncbi:MAG: hypothetical protein ACRDZO_01645 [Egibacteraceae bacterium]
MSTGATTIDPETIAKGIATIRVLLGIAEALWPRALMRMATPGQEPANQAVAALRMAGGRGLALGVGGLLAAKRGPHALRGWAEGGMLADALDAGSLATARWLRPALRWPCVASAVAASILGGVTARRLTR